MPRTVRIILILSLNLWLSWAATGLAQDKPPTPAEQFQSLLKEYDRSVGPFPKNDEERTVHVGKSYKHHNEVAQKLLELAEKYPKDPIALEALLQAVRQVNTIPWPVEMVGEDTARAKAFEIIIRDHIQSKKLIPVCQRVSYGIAKEYETFLRTVIAKNPHKNVVAVANLSLGHYLHNRLQRIELCRVHPEQMKDFEGLYGKEYMAELQRRDRKKELQEIETILAETIKDYADVTLAGGESLAEQAKLELYEVQNLSVGKVAPDIDAEDQNGKRFKLSDYRGKVVLLDFWSYV